MADPRAPAGPDEAWRLGVEQFILRQEDILMETYMVGWQRGVAALLEEIGSPRPAQEADRRPWARWMDHALKPARRSLDKMRRELMELGPFGDLSAWITQGLPRLLGGSAVAWSGEQAGYAEAADRYGLPLRWVTEGDRAVCADCLANSMEPPRRISLWHTIPGAGETECSYGCRCALEVDTGLGLTGFQQHHAGTGIRAPKPE